MSSWIWRKKVTIQEYCWWESQLLDLKIFCYNCLHCSLSAPGSKFTRMVSHKIYAEKPNEVIHFDLIYMDKGENDLEYVLIIKDDDSQNFWILPFKYADGDAEVQGLLKWFSAFEVSPSWVSDSGSYFKNSLMKDINREMQSSHQFTVPNALHTNGTVERVCREFLRCCCTLLS